MVLKQEMISMSIKMLSMSFGVANLHLAVLQTACRLAASENQNRTMPANEACRAQRATRKDVHRPVQAKASCVIFYLEIQAADVDI
ncbi:hypothetical protein [Undibacterium sp.]|uniref:hypothetical protein n=1 Tax=Undibacterium sp. TaxID=1914977 RepID=UPI002CB666AB|nr:hypothetical protein [Undibacterium sp.]HTD06910.1 hypothetical protein [Undibacterium sp.]